MLLGGIMRACISALFTALAVSVSCGCSNQAEIDRIFQERHSQPLEIRGLPEVGQIKTYELRRQIQMKTGPGGSAVFRSRADVEVVEMLADGSRRVRWTYRNFECDQKDHWEYYSLSYNTAADIPIDVIYDDKGTIKRIEGYSDLRKRLMARLDQLVAESPAGSEEERRDRVDWVKDHKEYMLSSWDHFVAGPAVELNCLFAGHGRTYRYGQTLEEQKKRFVSFLSNAYSIEKKRITLKGFHGTRCETALIESTREIDRTPLIEYVRQHSPEKLDEAIATAPPPSPPTKTTIEIDIQTRWPVKCEFVKTSAHEEDRRVMTLEDRP